MGGTGIFCLPNKGENKILKKYCPMDHVIVRESGTKGRVVKTLRGKE